MNGARTLRDGMLRGPSAHGLLLAGYLTLIPPGLILLTLGVAVISHGPYNLNAHAAEVVPIGVFFVLCVLTGSVLLQAALLRVRKEAASGYVTLPYSFRSFDLRHPRTGAVLRERGTPGGNNPLSVSLRPWRKTAAR